MRTYTVRYYMTKSDFPNKLTDLVIEAPSFVEMLVHLLQMNIPMYSLFHSYLDWKGHPHPFSRPVYDYACYQLKCLNFYYLVEGFNYE